MLTILKGAKEAFERISGSRIYRNSLPHGTDCFFDIGRRFGRQNIKVVFDIGANTGQSALRYLKEFPQADVHSFEPVEATYGELSRTTGPFSRVHTYKLGMGRVAGEALIHVNPMSRISSIVLSRPEDREETIHLETVAGFARKHKLETIDFLKVDTEGFDLEVLAGAAPLLEEQRIRFVQSECEPVCERGNLPACRPSRSLWQIMATGSLECMSSSPNGMAEMCCSTGMQYSFVGS